MRMSMRFQNLVNETRSQMKDVISQRRNTEGITSSSPACSYEEICNSFVGSVSNATYRYTSGDTILSYD